MKEVLMNAVNELREKDKIIEDLKNKLKETINKNKINFDENEIVNSVSQKLLEKDTLIQSLKEQIQPNEFKNFNESKNKFEELKKTKDDFISSLKQN
jgi:hypothetical protein